MQVEPHFKKAACAYCGDAPVPHRVFFVLNLIGETVDDHIKKVARYAPKVLSRFADFLPRFLFKTFAFFKMARFSNDIEKAKTFRSRVIWEEARRRGIKMEQLILWGKPLEYYRAILPTNREIFFESIPIPEEFLYMRENWDDKRVLKEVFIEAGIPVPALKEISFFKRQNIEKLWGGLTTPVIVKPKIGSRGRHTTTNITSLEQFREAVNIGKKLSASLVVEEHLNGYVCRATVVQGKLLGFYRGGAATVVGDGKSTILELIEVKNKNRIERVGEIVLTKET